MLSSLRKLFNKQPKSKEFKFLIVENYDDIIENTWYRKAHWNNPYVLRIKTKYSNDWSLFSDEEIVKGTSQKGRDKNFLILGDQPNFKVYLERETNNKHDKNAIKVMGSATMDGYTRKEELGYLSRETAAELKNEEEIKAIPYSVWLPHDDYQFGLRIRVLTRSVSYLKRTGKIAKIKKKQKEAIPRKRDIRNDVLEEVYEYYSCDQESYDCKRISKSLFRKSFNMYFDEALALRKLSEVDINQLGNDFEVYSHLCDDLTDILDDIVETVLKIAPDLRK